MFPDKIKILILIALSSPNIKKLTIAVSPLKIVSEVIWYHILPDCFKTFLS